MKPYYETELGKLYHGDCLEIMPHLELVDLVVTSPPYDNLRDYGGHVFDFYRTAFLLRNLLAPGGVIVWVVGDTSKNGTESGDSFRQALFFKALGLNIHDTMIYLKDGSPFPSSKRYRQVFEYMFVFSNGDVSTFNPILRKNAYSGISSNSYRQKTGETIFRTIKTDGYGTAFNVWQYNTGYMKSTQDKVAFEHPAIFPELLAQDHISSWTNRDDIILDPMSGSGTVIKQSERLNRRWIGIEIEEKYCEIAAKRIEKENQQLKLFK